ncbi:dysbindin domain-containing protein 2-like isoform X2 [Eucyclogobius newberryi]|uniref:dysbindin domain-containing protein 2-like isoform X2 n=1 Tax=Eucyclogobius newberryi TaxID=166745 RepID=UPI003B5989BD
MSTAGSANHNKRLASETDNSQRHLDNDSRLKLKDRQRFFEDVYQHDVDNYLPSTHLQINCRKPPMGSISSMEVNVDVLEQMDLMDISDQEALDVFLNSGSGSEEAPPTPSLPAEDEEEEEVLYREGVPLKRHETKSRSKIRILSTSSGSSDTSGADADTPVIQSDDEEVHADTLLLTSVPQTRDEESDEDEEQRCAKV